MFCCRNASDAKKAIIWSSLGQALTYLMLLVGAALFAFYYMNPPEGDVAAKLAFKSGGELTTLAQGGTPVKPDMVFPIWIVTELPQGLKGLILAGVFAAAISSLDSILAALSQTTISLLDHPENNPSLNQTVLVKKSRQWVVIWGVLLTGFTFLMSYVQSSLKINVLPLAFGMTSYTMGPLLGMFLCALIGKGCFRGILIGAIISFLMTMFLRMDVWILFEKAGMNIQWLANLPSYYLSESGDVKMSIASHWMWPVGTILTFFGGQIGARVKGD